MQTTLKEAKGAQTLAIHLRADLVDGRVTISGPKDRVKLPRNSGPHTFRFQLTDHTNLNIRFSGFGAELGETCPSETGDNTGQIIDLQFANRQAEFTDKNTGDPLTFGYTWFFECDDASQKPTFDPIVDNGGRD